MAQPENLNMVIVGDGGCGKTSLLMAYSKRDFSEKYVPSVFEKVTTTSNFGGRDIILNIYDTAGQEDYDRLRPLSYPDANLVFICYDVTNPTSFENVLLKWYPEVHHFCRGLPILLIGCKTDLRKNKEQTRKLRALGLAPITYLQGVEAMRQMKAELYLECSAKYQENVMDIFREAVKRGLTATQRARQARRKANFCTML
ncbi:rho-related GTP-binding protein RhoF-like [Paramormyrops kingsleyae]|uniref:Ras homolog family member F, filopodia associated n=1 Tax=Paramormyrops kingsleyae TaxID=1676925 RepID=A0A3B3QMN4_9TELE|nr:rho-related GTP-binding protein RhoF-like [Paramormyrops kingsleyae]XP_023658604.1 rho-related GTP-binding protein RhoF-like [Paramormyrops kingsleyae]